MRLFIILAFALATVFGQDDCDETNCSLPDCTCFSTESPIPADNTPQIVVISFDDAITVSNNPLYQYISQYDNPNGCPISMTFFVSHKYTDYSLAYQLHRGGHEIAVHSVTHEPDVIDYWVPATLEEWESEIMDAKNMMVKYGLIPEEEIKGFRAPFLVVGGNEMYGALMKNNFKYDCSWPTQIYTNWYKPNDETDPLGGAFPFTLDFPPSLEKPTYGDIPTDDYPGLWVAPMLDLQDGRNAPCAMLDACLGPQFNCTTSGCEDDLYQFLKDNFDLNYYGNRAPFGLYAHESWFHQGEAGETHRNAYLRFLGYLSSLSDVWIVSLDKLIEWTSNPTSLDDIDDFEPFQCEPIGTDLCTDTEECEYDIEDNEHVIMKICGKKCPVNYPWLGNVDGN